MPYQSFPAWLGWPEDDMPERDDRDDREDCEDCDDFNDFSWSNHPSLTPQQRNPTMR